MYSYYEELKKRTNENGEALKYLYFKIPTDCIGSMVLDQNTFLNVVAGKGKLTIFRSEETEEKENNLSLVAKVRNINNEYFIPVPYEFFSNACLLEIDAHAEVFIVNKYKIELTSIYAHQFSAAIQQLNEKTECKEKATKKIDKHSTKKASKSRRKAAEIPNIKCKENTSSYQNILDYWECNMDINRTVKSVCSVSYDEAGYAILDF